MTARVQIQIEAKDAASGVLRAVASQFGQLGAVGSDLVDVFKTSSKELGLYNKMMMGGSVSTRDMAKATEEANAAQARFAEQAVLMVIEGVKESINVTMEYAEKVRDLTLASGASADEASRLLQVLDDYQIQAEDVTAATRFLTKNGFAPTIETIAQLSDQYVQLNSAQEKNKFILDNLGRGGMQWANALAQGGDKLLQLNDGISEHLILTEKDIQRTEEFRLAQDQLGDNIEGAKIELGLAAISIVNTNFEMERLTKMAMEMGETSYREAQRFAASIVSMENNTNSATTSYTAWAKSVQNSKPVIEDVADATSTFKDDLAQLKDILDGDLGNAQDAYNAKMAEYNKQLAEARSQKEKDEINTNIAAETEAYNQRALAIMFNIQQEAILNSTMPNEEKLQMITALGQAYGMYDEETAKAMETTNGWISRVEEGTLSVEAATQWMKDMGNNTRQTTKTIPPFTEQMQHLEARSGDAALTLYETNEAQAALAQGINSQSGPAVHYLVSGLDALPPSYSAWYYDIYVTTHKSGGGTTFSTPDIGAGQGYQTGVHVGSGSGRQTGGEVYAMNPYAVGETGPEPFYPAVDGRILGHAESMHALAQFGSRGGTNNFYGPVSLTLSESDAGSITTMR